MAWRGSVSGSFVGSLVLALLDAGCEPAAEAPSRFGSDLHAQPARCGIADYQWVDDPSLGEVLEREEARTNEVDVITTYLDLLRDKDLAVVAHAPQHRVFLDRFRYVTQDRGQLVEATGIVAFPDPSEIDQALPLLVYTHGTVGFTDACAPSVHADSPVALDAAMASAFASFGYYVVAPDYLGMKSLGAPSTELHPYLNGEPTAIATLDAARAAQRMAADDGIALGATLVAGASQGGHAAALTVRYQPHYAAELELAGAIYAIPPLDFAAHAAASMTPPASATQVGNIVSTMLAAQDWFRLGDDDLGRVVDLDVAHGVRAALHEQCQWPELAQPLEEIFTPETLAATHAPGLGNLQPWSCIFTQSSLVDTDVPRLEEVPALMILGSEDALVDATIERAAFSMLCDRGLQLQLIECAGRDHAGAFLATLDQMLDFLAARANGEPLAETCAATPAQVCASDPSLDDPPTGD